jgi:hypothetical protein
MTYPNSRSAILPAPHGPEIPIPSRPENLDVISPVPDCETSGSVKSDSDCQAEIPAKAPGLFTQTW